jgi:hypothetical protein
MLLRFGQGNGWVRPVPSYLSGRQIHLGHHSLYGTTRRCVACGLRSLFFSSLFGVYEATDLLRNDLINDGESQLITKQAQDLNWIYAIVSSTDDFVIVGNKYLLRKRKRRNMVRVSNMPGSLKKIITAL